MTILNSYPPSAATSLHVSTDGTIEIVLPNGNFHQIPIDDQSQKFIWIYTDDAHAIVVATSDIDTVHKYLNQTNILYSEIKSIEIESTSRSKNLYIDKKVVRHADFKTPIKNGLENRIAIELTNTRLLVHYNRDDARS